MNKKRILLESEYSFDASAKTITFSGFTPIHQNILVIINVTDDIVIYSSTTPAKKGSVSGQVLTLDYNTTGMDDTDNLQITYYDKDYVTPVSATSLPLPSDAATQTTLALIKAKTDNLDIALSGIKTGTDKIIAAPATEAKQDTGNTALSAIQTAVQILDNFISGSRGLVTEDNSAAILTALNAIGTLLAGTLSVSGSVGVSGSVTANAGTNLNTSALALEATLQSVKTAVETIDNFISSNRGLVTEDNSAAILAKISADPSTGAKQDTANTALSAIQTAVQVIDNFISGSRGLVTEDNSAAILTAVQAIQTAVQIIDNAISGNEMQVDVLTLPSLPAGTNNIGDIDVLSLPALPTGTNTIGNVGIVPQTSGGLSIFRSIDLDETEEDVKTSAGQLFGWYLFNNHATDVRFVKLYNATAANVTVGSTTPVMTIPLPPKGGANVLFETGIAFSTAITAAATTGVADADTGTPGANEVIANFFYK